MSLPLKPPLKPQLALTRKQLPLGEEWAYEPKLDGFRAIVFVDGDDAYIQSRGGKALARYFPELSFPEGRYVVDGELVIRDERGEPVFDALQSRIHPADSRIGLLSKEIPASFIAFDLLAEGDEVLLERPLSERRERLGRSGRRPRADRSDPEPGGGRALAAPGRRGDGEAARRPLRPRQAQGDGEGEARADDRLRRPRLAPRARRRERSAR